ncbi:5-formyltetrahydrofolate cyclo-ligase [Neobacillus drentensis]|uniref:5-formyltetrahydrofolate cyclo-ligase n=1 Tax=Neobacillus drentensis TaxID=220684 RepID=UPI002FFFA967
MNNKKSIRIEMKEILSRLPKASYEDYSQQIAGKLYEDHDWKQAQVIGITISKSPEVDTYPIIRKAWELGKDVVVPKCDPENRMLTFRRITDFSQLETVFYNLLEPIENVTEPVGIDRIELLIVPGLAFTREGYRLGFGGGYYDRYLLNYSGKALSLAFEEQILPQFHIENHDIPVSKIITNHEVIKIK